MHNQKSKIITAKQAVLEYGQSPTSGNKNVRVAAVKAALPDIKNLITANREGIGFNPQGEQRVASHCNLNTVAAELGYTNFQDGVCHDFLADLGVSHRLTLQQFSTLGDTPDNNWLLNETILAMVSPDLAAKLKISNKLIAGTIRTNGGKVIVPEYEGDMRPDILRENEAMSLGSVTFKARTLKPFVVGKAFEVTEDLYNELRIDAFREAMPLYDVEFTIAKIHATIATVISGDNLQGTTATSSIGVVNPSGSFSITYQDLTHAAMCCDYDTIVCNTTTLLGIMNLPELKGGNFQSRLISLDSMQRNTEYKTVRSELLADNEVLFVDSRMAIQEWSHRGRSVIKQFDPRKRVHEFFITDGVGYRVQDRLSSVFMNGTQLFTGVPSEYKRRYSVDSGFDYNTYNTYI